MFSYLMYIWKCTLTTCVCQVVANCIMALDEVYASTGGIEVNKGLIYNLLNRMKEFNEWSQVYITRSLASSLQQALLPEMLNNINSFLFCTGELTGNSFLSLEIAKPY